MNYSGLILITTFLTFPSLVALLSPSVALLSVASLFATSKTDWFGTNSGGTLNVSETVADAFCTNSSRDDAALFVALLYIVATFCAMDSWLGDALSEAEGG